MTDQTPGHIPCQITAPLAPAILKLAETPNGEAGRVAFAVDSQKGIRRVSLTVTITLDLPAAPREPESEQPVVLSYSQKKRRQKQRAKARREAAQIVQDVEVAGNVGEALLEALAVNGAKESEAVR